MAQQFDKPLTMGVNLENGFFSEDGSTGFNMSAYAGRLNMKFWQKGQKSGENRDNSVSLNIAHVSVLNRVVGGILQARVAAFRSGGVAAYPEISNLGITVDGFVNNQYMVFAIIKFDTVEIDGVRRVRMTVTRNETTNYVTFYDKNLANAITGGTVDFDLGDTNFLRFCTDINNWTNFSWTQGAFNKLFNAVVGNSNGGGSKGQSSSYNRGGNSGGGQSHRPSAPKNDDDAFLNSPIFDDEDF